MNLIIQTYDADTWQLVPKEATPEMLEAIRPNQDASLKTRFLRMLFIAPQPETISPWRDIESAPKDGSLVLVGFWRDGEAFYDFDFLNDGIWQLYFDRAEHYQIGGGNISPEKAPYTHWMPLPQAPTALLGATGATAPEVER